MDYKELIASLRYTVKYGDEDPREYLTNMCGSCEMCDQAADAIETLLVERDALLTVSHGKCELCANFGKCRSDARARIDCLNNRCKSWKWRGPQKGDGHGDLPQV